VTKQEIAEQLHAIQATIDALLDKIVVESAPAKIKNQKGQSKALINPLRPAVPLTAAVR
jgi:restriction endonuclease S subunit